MEPVVTIAIPDVAGSAARAATLQALARHTSTPYQLVLLLDASQSAPVSPEQSDLVAHQVRLPGPLNTPAALNCLLATCTTPYILHLESGATVTAGWLSKLLAPFDDPTVGLSGPSTNASWNEQKVLAGSEGTGWSVNQIDAYAATIAKRYSHQRRSLDTLHSLGDFCYLFKRSLAEQLGGFDEAYGPGPCWEIDFNTRAARAGFFAVWVVDAYVHRSPSSPWKVTSVRQHFTASKQLYQDRFCGLRLQGKKTDYEPHCKGEACEHFAPPALIKVTLQPAPTSSPVAITSNNEPPLVSCIMPTRNRRAYIPQALAYFERQRYPNRELIIVDDGEDKIADLVPPDDPRIRYVALPAQVSIGAKRNHACQAARGEIIAHWDDDDWYAPHRLDHQVAPLLAGAADVSGLETSCFFDLAKWETWTCSPELHRRLFVGDVHGGTLVYWRRLWANGTRYPDTSLAEDAQFLQLICRRGARLQKLPHNRSFVYLRHDNNAWRFPLGQYLQPSGWRRVGLSEFLPASDLSFYLSLSPAASSLSASEGALSASSDSSALVSCIMPTCNRRAFVLQAIAYFLRQDYPNRELIIVDDGSDEIGDLVPLDERIRYIRLREKRTVGVKRNIACEQARGTIIAHWDDDDWHASHRLSYQVATLAREGSAVCGTSSLLFYDAQNERAWQYTYPAHQRTWLVGGTLCYTRAFWASNRFANMNVGEDARFIWNSRPGQATRLPDFRFYVGMVHRHNTSPKNTSGSYWRPYAVEEIRRLLGADWSFYHIEQAEMTAS